jgi:hypothetical protein
MRKKFILCFLATLALLTSCVTCADMDANGKYSVSKEFPVAAFSALEIDGPCNIFIRQGEKESVTVKTSEENLKKILVENQGTTLIIDFDSFFGNHKQIDVYITFVKIDRMVLKGAGNIETKSTLHLDTLTIENNRAGNLNLSLNCKRLNIKTGGAGNVDISGSAHYAWIEKTGVGNFNSSGFKVDFVKLKNSGVGNTDVYAEKELYLKSSGVGNVSYSGNPIIKEYNVSGVGNVTKQ